ncbi:MAG TPA: NAD(P)/FAD-dependent oxidoreductase [Acidimicrobiales bacterium]|nr:NAD(P)/FAD-dependent oxidoreductase [Acidimicrobiales bacterium]
METRATKSNGNTKDAFDAIVVGAGWAGMYMLHRLRLLGLSVRVVEAGSGVGGTWYWNRYPGARCDVASLDYSYSFSDEIQQEWVWSERYAAQPEVERYANFVADRLDLRRDIQFDTRVTSAEYVEALGLWQILTDKNESYSAKYCFMAIGIYSAPNTPQIQGIESFRGEMFHTALWPKENVEFSGKRIGVIGTGSSGVQTITAIAGTDVKHINVFQRTAGYAVPARNSALDPEFLREFKKSYTEYREAARRSRPGITLPFGGPLGGASEEEFTRRMDEAWEHGGVGVVVSVADAMTDKAVNERVAEYLRQKVRERVDDPVIAEALCAKGYHVGARRMVVETGYFELFNQPNVTLVDLNVDPIVEIVPGGVRTKHSTYELDMLVLATGFDSGTGAALRIAITGRNCTSLSEKWRSGPVTFLGLMVAGFPNLFFIAQPGSPSLRAQVMVAIEQHVDWLTRLVSDLEEGGIQAVEASPEAEALWTDHVAQTANATLISKDDTQYVGANIPGKPRVYLAYLGGVSRYGDICEAVYENGYEGLLFTKPGERTMGKRVWSGPPEDEHSPTLSGRTI